MKQDIHNKLDPHLPITRALHGDGLTIREILESPWLGIEPYFDLEWAWKFSEEYAEQPVKVYTAEERAEYERQHPDGYKPSRGRRARRERRFEFTEYWDAKNQEGDE